MTNYQLLEFPAQNSQTLNTSTNDQTASVQSLRPDADLAQKTTHETDTTTLQTPNPPREPGNNQSSLAITPVEPPKNAVDASNDTNPNKGTASPQLFSESDTATLVEMWNAQHTVREIATAMGREFNNVRNKVAYLQKRGVIAPRANGNRLPEEFIEQTAGQYNLPIDLVAYFASLFGKGAQRIMAGTQEACEAWVAQGGECYYLRGRVRLTADESPSGVVPMYLSDGRMFLMCRAVASVRQSMSHGGFVSMCRHIAKVFENE